MAIVASTTIPSPQVVVQTPETPGPKIGYILNALLEEVLDKPELNTTDYLNNRAVELSKLPVKELIELGNKGKEKKDRIEKGSIEEINKKYHVQ
jgi:hypothetical protein